MVATAGVRLFVIRETGSTNERLASELRMSQSVFLRSDDIHLCYHRQRYVLNTYLKAYGYCSSQEGFLKKTTRG
jgi:hypothetical protein